MESKRSSTPKGRDRNSERVLGLRDNWSCPEALRSLPRAVLGCPAQGCWCRSFPKVSTQRGSAGIPVKRDLSLHPSRFKAAVMPPVSNARKGLQRLMEPHQLGHVPRSNNQLTQSSNYRSSSPHPCSAQGLCEQHALAEGGHGSPQPHYNRGILCFSPKPTPPLVR